MKPPYDKTHSPSLLNRILGGRPMKYQGCMFIDCVSGLEVNHYIDRLGRHWLANSAWSLFRVEKP
jgi:hypothetical protein